MISPPSPSNLIEPSSLAPSAETVPWNSIYPENGSPFANSSLKSIVIFPSVVIRYVPTALPLDAYTKPVSSFNGFTPLGS